MNNNKQIIKYCPNFYRIINFNPILGDELTDKIIQMYQEYIFKVDINDEEAINEIKELDAAIAKYINDYSFRKEVQKRIVTVKIKQDCKDVIKYLMDFIIKLFTDYSDYTTRVIYISKWI